jgi:hypothetical protein
MILGRLKILKVEYVVADPSLSPTRSIISFHFQFTNVVSFPIVTKKKFIITFGKKLDGNYLKSWKLVKNCSVSKG